MTNPPHTDQPAASSDASGHRPPAEAPGGADSPAHELEPNQRAANVFWATMAGSLVLVFVVMFSSGIDSTARGVLSYLEPLASRTGLFGGATEPTANVYRFEDLDIHPDLLFQPYTAGELVGLDASTSAGRMVREFRTLLDLYEQRQGEDDNFTIRVVDNRTEEVLEVYELHEERRAYESNPAGEVWNWARIDEERRALTRRLVDKYAEGSRPRDAVTVKWGRRNQIVEARERDEPFIEYEVRLARYLDMSLLLTEIGTVETFNNDRLVSPVGARSRYQMMPFILRQNDVHHYGISTAAGNRVDVREEWHPLLTMEPAFVTAAGYRNAVGHEIPGLSAYHTGPGNIYMVYRQFLTAGSGLFTPESTVMDAYVWAVTTGYDTVSRRSSFGSYSRGYIASAYGALRATQSVPIDTTKTVEAVRVRLRDDQSLFLSQLLRTLGRSTRPLDWGPGTEDLSEYDRFQHLNPHFDLPRHDPVDADRAESGVPPMGDVQFTATADGHPVRFFLPLGAPAVLADAGLDIIDPAESFRFTHDTYAGPAPSEITEADRLYEALIDDVAHFGFTNENRRRLARLVDEFEALARSNPTHFRRTQLQIIHTHERMWGANVFNRLAAAVEAARGQLRFEPRPPSPLPTGSAPR